MKIDLFPDEVYVFTPGGDIIELPRGATAVDFAYAIHSDIGHQCIAAKVDKRLAPLSMPLSNGQTVEIVTASGACPNASWLDFVVTGKARSNIRHFLNLQQKSHSIAFGKRLMDKALADLGTERAHFTSVEWQQIVKKLNYKSLDDLHEAVGLGNQVSLVVAKHLVNLHYHEEHYDIEHSGATKPQPLYIKGTEGMVVQFAECCRPIPGDPIIGILQTGQGIVVHADICDEIETWRNKPERFINMSWEESVSGEFHTNLIVEVANRRGALAVLATAIAEAEANIENIRVDPRDGQHNIVHFVLTVRNRRHLAQVIRRIRAIRMVYHISRHGKSAGMS